MGNDRLGGVHGSGRMAINMSIDVLVIISLFMRYLTALLSLSSPSPHSGRCPATRYTKFGKSDYLRLKKRWRASADTLCRI